MKKIEIKKESEIYTEQRVSISTRIAEGRTILIPGIGYHQEMTAKEIAEKNRTYFVPVFEIENGRLKQYGYAVPK